MRTGRVISRKESVGQTMTPSGWLLALTASLTTRKGTRRASYRRGIC